MFIINPDPYLTPSFKISPFRTKDIRKNKKHPNSHHINGYLNKRFGHKKYIYTYNGREAINIALTHYNLSPKDTVSILTTSGNFYVSSCVTTEIERFCKWNREVNEETKVIFIIHEFGFPFRNLPKIKKTGIPIIEDCAHSFFSTDENFGTGKTGDFTLFSLPKIFPVQIGGILVNNTGQKIKKISVLNNNTHRYIRNTISHCIQSSDEIIAKRIANFRSMVQKFKPLGISPRFDLEPHTVPGVFMFKPNKTIDLDALKSYYYRHGIQCSVFYGEDAFFIPCHQNLCEEDMDYFVFVYEQFLSQN